MQPLGQHFLKDKKVLEKIADSLNISSQDIIVEVGPGHGELTQYILEESPKKIIAIEKDKDLVSSIQYLVSENDNLEVIEGDALKILPTISKTYNLKSFTFKIVGNIPYYITGKLLRVMGELAHKPDLIVLTIQKEVAERLCAEPPKMNLLAASVRFWGEPEIVKTVSRNAFRPRPKVESAIIRITPRKDPKNQEEIQKYYNFIKALFKQPRKTILNNLVEGSNYTKQEVENFLKSRGIEPKLRPQNLDADTINNLSQSFYKDAL